MDAFDVFEAERIVSVIRSNLHQFPDIQNIWIDYDEMVVVITAAVDGLEYVSGIGEFVRTYMPHN